MPFFWQVVIHIDQSEWTLKCIFFQLQLLRDKDENAALQIFTCFLPAAYANIMAGINVEWFLFCSL